MIRKLLSILFPVTLLLLTACSADEHLVMPGADGNTTINLLIPSTEMASANTRADADASHGNRDLVGEGKITKLAVVGFYNNSKNHFYAELDKDMSSEVSGVYSSYKLAVVPGQYTLYVLANMSEDLAGLKNELKGDATAPGLEEKVKNLVHSYGVTLPDTEKGLPMAGTVYADVTENQSKEVMVNLGFLCSKVRVTVIYNESTTPLKINGIDLNNVWDKSKVFLNVDETHGTLGDLRKVENAGSEKFYRLTDDLCAKELSYWTKKYEDVNNDPVETMKNLTTLSNNSAEGYVKFSYQNTLYVPECSGKGDNSTYINLKSGNGTARINIGCGGENDTHTENIGGNIERGHFYDIVAMVAGGKVEYLWNVKPWTPEQIAVQLAGISRLYVADTVIESIDGDTPYELYYETDAPNLTFESSKDSAGKPLFLIKEDKENNVLVVSLNTETNLTKDVHRTEGMGFWVISGSIRKWISVNEIDLTTFLRLLPKSANVIVRNIINEYSYSTEFEYATNDDNLSLKITELTNDNKYSGYDEEDGAVSKGIYVQILNSERKPVTEIMALDETHFVPTENFTSDFTSLPNTGYIRVTLVAPTNPDYFSKEIKAVFEASTDTFQGEDAETAELVISPNPTMYTIHFKAINGAEWTSPHIYIYQPLSYKGYPVYEDRINWIEYSFTGNMAFRGWTKDGGAVAPPGNLTNGLEVGGGDIIDAYNVDWSYDGPSKATGYQIGTGADDKYIEVQLIDNSQSSCSTCKNGNPNLLWPGMGMTRESNGWWKIEIPLIVKPDVALVMFADGHGNNGKDESDKRYPINEVPGIPIPNYSDREAWYLYDASRGGDNCAFSDDRRESYTAPITGGDEENITIYCYNTEGWENMHVQINGTGWPGSAMSKSVDDAGVPLYYIRVPKSTSKLIFNNNGDSSTQITLQPSGGFTNGTYYNNSDGAAGKISLPAVASGKKRLLTWLPVELTNNPYVYYFVDNNTNTGWDNSNLKMTQVKGKVYYYDGDPKYSNAVIRSGGNQSNDITGFSNNVIVRVTKK